MKKPDKLLLGSIVAGTIRSEELFDAFLQAAEGLSLTRPEADELRQLRKSRADVLQNSEWLSTAVCTLEVILDSHVPPFCHFGVVGDTNADQRNYAVRPAWEEISHAIEDGIIEQTPLRVDMSYRRKLRINIPEFNLVRAGGSMTLFQRRGRRWVEQWTIAETLAEEEEKDGV
jgi:hypothetical protein